MQKNCNSLLCMFLRQYKGKMMTGQLIYQTNTLYLFMVHIDATKYLTCNTTGEQQQILLGLITTLAQKM